MSLPYDMIDLVLCRVPVKPLLRFRCVCKGWCSLIDSNAFVKKHVKTTIECNNGGGLLINDDAGKIYLADFDSLDDGSAAVVEISNSLQTILSGVEVFSAANGLVCAAKNEMNEIFLFNPSTRKARKLPSAPAEFPRTFDTVETSICGFGYDHVNDDYKVVKIADCKFQFQGFMVVVYSLKTNSWKRIHNVPSNICFYLKWGVFASGALHWLGSKNPGHGLETIVGYDLGLEQFKEIPFPAVNKKYVNINYRSLGPVGESLCILDNYPNFSVDVWLMKEYGAENPWYKAFAVKQPVLLNFAALRPLAFSKSCKVVLVEVDNAKLMWYDPKRKTAKNVRIRGIPNSFYSYLYTESLLKLSEDKPVQKPSQDMLLMKQKKKRDDFLSRGFSLKL
ncbi:F-box domain-containing protein [Heracleum sosnowskyi]|uniref:F-box domain-containing protein n=1 Tax=Heracleum sosnowskyi TaxID=360622 RepID=A0AAD8HK15_9APIA|nr:F-box domain-containing protein [Heracleum sosnowskyi]